MPLAIALEKQARSAVTPNRSWAPPSAQRKPVHISSKTRRAPRPWHSREQLLRGSPAAGSSNTVGSRITQAVSSIQRLLDRGDVVVSDGMGQPGHLGRHARAAVGGRDVPVVPAVVAAAEHLVDRPVKARARRTAALVTSAPVLEKRTMSAPGTTR